ncbi:MAG TPA: lipoate--protein ligase [Bacteroidetes bacterium]|nr:lipoate--protein ligase [Bacteroidota bacterium]
MLIIDNSSTDPWFNIAAEEYLFRNFEAEIFMVYINARSVIIGKHQNPLEEVNARCLRENNIPLIRRISGGGTVYHDEGNMNYTLIRNTEDGKQVNFSEYTKPLVSFLKKEGVDAYKGEKNEIRTGNMKISGNAEHVFKNRVLHHGTLLFSADLGLMSRCLAQAQADISSRAVKSNPGSVANLDGYMENINSVDELKAGFLEYISGLYPDNEYYKLNERDIKQIQALKINKFMTWEWNYAWGPDYTFSKTFRIGEEEANVKLEVSKGIIRACKFSGPGSWEKVETLLPGTRHFYDDIAILLNANMPVSDSDLIYNFIM